LATLYTWDAILVTPQGPVYGPDAIKYWYADMFEQWHPKNQIDKVDPDSLRLIRTAGDAVWMNGEWTRTIQGPNGGQHKPTNYSGTFVGGTVFCPFYDGKKFKWKLCSNVYPGHDDVAAPDPNIGCIAYVVGWL
jgi:hypothetical protein